MSVCLAPAAGNLKIILRKFYSQACLFAGGYPPDLDIGKSILLFMNQDSDEERGALGLIREVPASGDIVADFPIDKNIHFDTSKPRTTVRYISSLKEGTLTVGSAGLSIGMSISSKREVRKVSKR